MARRVLSEDEETEINLSPMIDCIFILLIFFIVTTVFVEEQGLQVAKPDAAAASALEPTENLVLEITAENKIVYEKREIQLGDVVSKVKASAAAELPVVIRAHEKADHGTFVSVWDAAVQAGAFELTFNTVN